MTEPPPDRAKSPQRPWAAWLGQAILYLAFAGFIGVFSHWPPYRHLKPDEALVKLSFVHTGKPAGECRKRTPEELEKLPPNMRAPMECPRGRSTVSVEMDIDGKPAARIDAQPSGLSRDGASSVYQRVVVNAGERLIAVRMRDDARTPGFDYTAERRIALKPSQVLVVDFDSQRGGITFR